MPVKLKIAFEIQEVVEDENGQPKRGEQVLEKKETILAFSEEMCATVVSRAPLMANRERLMRLLAALQPVQPSEKASSAGKAVLDDMQATLAVLKSFPNVSEEMLMAAFDLIRRRCQVDVDAFICRKVAEKYKEKV